MVGVSCSNGDSPDGPDVPVTPVGQTVFMFFPWSNNLLSDFRRTVEDMQTVVAQRSMKDERIMVFMATSEREAVLFELKNRTDDASPTRCNDTATARSHRANG